MTTPLAAASTNVYTVEFDGFNVFILARKRHKVLRTIPLAELLAVEFKPANGIGGGRLRFRVTGKASVRDQVVFMGSQQRDIERLVATIQQHHRPPVQLAPLVQPSDPWADHPVEAAHRPQTVVVSMGSGSKSMMRLMTLGVWIEGINVVLMLIPVVLGAALVVAFFVLR